MSTSETTSRRWTSTAGPIQTKRVNAALAKITWEGRTYITLSGIVGVSEHRTVHTLLCGGTGRSDCPEALQKLGEQFDWKVTPDNCKDVVAAAESALAELVKNRPEKDERETQEAVNARMDEVERTRIEREAKENEKVAAFLNVYGERRG